jgi:methylenetetrahydrofolate dehydrogenase (NADP+)/methenyltetrahydrofolate cyclohydrolase
MTANILDGKRVSKHVLDEIKGSVEAYKKSTGKVPGLAVVLVGDNPASQFYVASKKRACESLGIASFEYTFPESISEEALIDCINALNTDENVHGILVQLPLPKHINADQILELIHPEKDVDGFHPMNVGRLLLGLDTYRSCTPYGVCKLLDFYHIDTTGKHVVIIGRSNIVGKPLAAMLVQPGYDATVTLCHSKSKDMKTLVKTADIIVAAVGKPHMVTKDMVKAGAVVIDVGINRVNDGSNEKGYTIVGDVDYESVSESASAITPVPGGVGVMTIAMLMSNTLQSFERTLKKIVA